MTREDVQAFFVRQREHWRSRSPEGLAEGHTEEGVVVSPIFKTVTGRTSIMRSYRLLFELFPDWDYRGEDLVIDGERVVEPFTVAATHVGEFMGLTGTGRRFEIHGVRLFHMQDGLIAHERRYYDFTGLLIQIGVLRGKPVDVSTVSSSQLESSVSMQSSGVPATAATQQGTEPGTAREWIPDHGLPDRGVGPVSEKTRSGGPRYP